MNLAAALDPQDSDTRVAVAPHVRVAIAEEFAAIMHASGFGDRVIATAALPRPDNAPRMIEGRADPIRVLDVAHARWARVRSPP